MIKSTQYCCLGLRDADSGVTNALLQGRWREADGMKGEVTSFLKVSKLLS